MIKLKALWDTFIVTSLIFGGGLMMKSDFFWGFILFSIGVILQFIAIKKVLECEQIK